MADENWTELVGRADIPVIIICRDMLGDLRRLVRWLEAAGHQRIILLDNASTYPPLLEYLAAAPHEVIRLASNLGHQSPWLSGLVDRVGRRRPFAVSDPDVLPGDSCPHDAVEHFQELLLKFPEFDKAGFGLRIDDLPEHYPHRESVRRWERPYWANEIATGVFTAHIDTTFAACRPGTLYKVTEALRTGPPYVARHLPWYRDPAQPDAETAYFFRERRDDIGYWNWGNVPGQARAPRTRPGPLGSTPARGRRADD